MNEVAFKITSFDFTHGFIYIPASTCWYRAYKPELSVLNDNPTFFGDMEVAFHNTKNGERKLGEFLCTRPLRLLDMRYVMSFLPFILQSNEVPNKVFEMIELSLGLCSFQKQIEILKKLDNTAYPMLSVGIKRMEQFQSLDVKPPWVNPVEMRGVRIGIGDIDFQVAIFLRDLLSPIVDGIIAPSLHSPFHDQQYADIEYSMMYQELLLFHPTTVLRHVCDRPITSKVKYFLPTGDVQQVMSDYPNILRSDVKKIRISRMYGGGDYTGTPIDREEPIWKMYHDKNFRNKVVQAQKSWQKAIKSMQKSHTLFKNSNIMNTRKPFKLLSPSDIPYSGTPKTDT
jgi:hypothetical protein